MEYVLFSIMIRVIEGFSVFYDRVDNYLLLLVEYYY